MADPILLKMEDGKEYKLEFSRKSVEWAERRGFTTDDLSEHMMIRVPELFYYSFRKNHPFMTKEQTDKILFEQLGGLTEEMLTRLVELYTDGYESLVNRSEDGVKNSTVTVIM